MLSPSPHKRGVPGSNPGADTESSVSKFSQSWLAPSHAITVGFPAKRRRKDRQDGDVSLKGVCGCNRDDAIALARATTERQSRTDEEPRRGKWRQTTSSGRKRCAFFPSDTGLGRKRTHAQHHWAGQQTPARTPQDVNQLLQRHQCLTTWNYWAESKNV